MDAEVIISIWFFIIFIVGTYVVYNCLQCFNYEKVLKKGKEREFKFIYFIICVCIAFLFASAFVTVIERIYNLITSLNVK